MNSRGFAFSSRSLTDSRITEKNCAKGLLLSFFIYIYLVFFVELCMIAELRNQPFGPNARL